MASLPAKHPSLAIHMTDRATTPLISSSSAATTSSTSSNTSHPHPQQQQNPQHRKRTQNPPTKFSTSPPSSPSSTPSPTPNDDSDSDETETPPSPATKQSQSLTSLTTTALLSYDAAKRLGRGAPLRTMVEYPDNGPVVLHSYMCPMGLALGVPGRRNGSSESLATAVGGKADDEADDEDGEGRQVRRTPTTSFALDTVGDDGGGGGGGGVDAEDIDPSDPPMLTSTVVAPRAEDLREARRATARLEKVARVFQAEWVSTGRR